MFPGFFFASFFKGESHATAPIGPLSVVLHLGSDAPPRPLGRAMPPTLQSSYSFLPLFAFHQVLFFSPLCDLLSRIALFHGVLPLALFPIFLSLFPSRPFLHLPWISEKFSLAFTLKMFSLSIHTSPPLQRRDPITLMRMVL